MTDLIHNIIRSATLNQHVYSKVRFDNAKDSNELIAIANENSDLLVQAVELRIGKRVEELLIELIDKSLKVGKTNVRVGNKWYVISEAEL